MSLTTVTEPATPAESGDAPFPSFASLRAAHSELLKRHRQDGDTPETISAIENFIRRGQGAGALIDSDQDREAAQSLLDYWATRLYRTGQEPPEATLAEFDPSQAPELDDSLNIYLGLDAFQESEKDLFFGRRRLIQHLIDHLRENRILAVVGPSGSGKSSLVRAGLIPEMKSGALETSAVFTYLPVMVPGSHPLENLSLLLLPTGDEREDWVRQQVEAFRASKDHLASLVAVHTQEPVVLVVDQFEETFTLCHDQDERQDFVENLLSLVQDREREHRVILTMRTDFESHVARLPEFQPVFEQALERVPPLNASELREAIEKPAQLVGLKFEAGLIDALLQDILGEPAALPLLQFTLLKLWESRDRNRVTWEAYKRLGGGRQALARSADEFFDALIPEEQVTARRILLRMVRPGEGLEVTSNRIQREHLYLQGEARDRIDRVLDKLIDAHLVRLTRGASPSDDQLEVAHEALVRNWPTLVSWLEEERIRIRERQRLSLAAEQWLNLGRDPSALLRGVLLREASLYEDLNELESEFLGASQAAVEAEEEARLEVERQRQEAETARKIAEIEHMRAEDQALAAHKLSNRLTLLRIVLGITILITIYAFITRNRAVTAEGAAISQRETATAAEALAVSGRATAEAERARAEVAEKIAVEAQATAEEARLQNEIQTRRNLSRQVAALSSTYRGTKPDLALLLGLEAYRIDQNSEATGAVSSALEFHPNLITYLHRYTEPVIINKIAFSPDGKIIASGDDRGSVYFWDLETRQPVGDPLFGNLSGITSLSFHPDNNTVVAGGCARLDASYTCVQGEIRVWDIASRSLVGPPLLVHGGYVQSLEFSPDGSLLASGGCAEWDASTACNSSEVVLWEWEDNSLQRISSPATEGSGTVWGVAFSPDGRTLAAGTDEGFIYLWDVSNPGSPAARAEPIDTLSGIYALDFSSDGNLLASAGFDHTISLWDISNRGSAIRIDTGAMSHEGSIFSLEFSKDGNMLASAGEDKVVRLWDISIPEMPILLGEPFTGHNDYIYGIGFSPDNSIVASGSADGAIILWSNEERYSPQPLPLQQHTAFVTTLAYSPDGEVMASAGCLSLSGDDTCIDDIRLWDARTGELLGLSIGNGENFGFDLAFLHNGRYLAASNADGNIYLFDVSDPEAPRALDTPISVHTTPVRDLDYYAGGRILASAGERGPAILFDVSDPDSPVQISPPINGHVGGVYSLAFSPDGRVLATGGYDWQIILWDVSDPSSPQMMTNPLTGHSNVVTDVAFIHNGEILISSSCGEYDNEAGSCVHGEILLWDTRTGEPLGPPIEGHTNTINSLAIHPSEKVLATGGDDWNIILWDLSDPASVHPVTQPISSQTDRIYRLAFNPDGTRLASASIDSTVLQWDITRWQAPAPASPLQANPPLEFSSEVHFIEFSPKDEILAVGLRGQEIELWDFSNPGSPSRLGMMNGLHTGSVLSLRFNEEGSILVSSGCGEFDENEVCVSGEIHLWDVATQEYISPILRGHMDAARSTDFSPDGNLLASGGDDGTILLWEVSDPQKPTELVELDQHTDSVRAVAFSPDGSVLASGSEDNTIILWDVSDPRSQDLERTQLPGESMYINNLTFSPDGKYLASAGCGEEQDTCVAGVIRFWDVVSKAPIGAPITAHGASVVSIAFSPDGMTMASSAYDGSLLLWDVSTPQSPRSITPLIHDHTVPAWSIAFNSEGSILASGSADRTVRLWDVRVESWRNRACGLINRNLTAQEWKQHLGGNPYHATCGLQTPPSYMNNATASAQTTDEETSKAAYEEAVRVVTNGGDMFLTNAVCWYGSIDGFPDTVLPACEKTIEIANKHNPSLIDFYRDSRGLALALTGQYQEAIEDFRAFVAWAEEGQGLYDIYAEKRSYWISELTAGRDPFTPNTVESLRNE